MHRTFSAHFATSVISQALLGNPHPKITPLEQVCALGYVPVRLTQPRELPSRYIPRRFKVPCRADVERNRHAASLLTLVVQVLQPIVNKPLRRPLGCVWKRDAVLDHVGIPSRRQNEYANELHMLQNAPACSVNTEPTFSPFFATQYRRFSKSSQGSKDVCRVPRQSNMVHNKNR